MSSNITYISEVAEDSLNHAKLALRTLLRGSPSYSEELSDAVVDLIFCAAVMESNANLRYVLQK